MMSKSILEFPIKQIHENMVFNKNNEVWAFYSLQEEYLKLNNETEFNNYVEKTAEFLSNAEYDYHIMVIPRKFDFENFTKVINENIVSGAFEDIGKTYFERAQMILENEVFLHEYIVYVSVHLNKSDKVVTTDVNDFIKKFAKRVRDDVSKVMTLQTNVEDDIDYYSGLERGFRNKTAYNKECDRLKEEEIQNLIYYNFHRTSDTFQVPNGQYNLTEGIIQNNNGYMTIKHYDYTEYISFLPISEMPVTVHNSQYILDMLENVDFPLEIQMKYNFKENDSNIRQVRKLKRRFSNFDREIQSTNTADEDSVVETASERMGDLLDDVKENNRQLLFLTMTLVISDTDKEILDEKYQALLNLFKNTKFSIARPLVDQLTLFSQSLPASFTEYKYFEQVVDETYLAQSSMDVSNKVGNRFGMVLGKVVTGKKLSSVEQAREINNNIVVFNPTLTKKSLKGAVHTNGNILITGPPGSGKSMLTKYFFTWSTFFGTKVLYIDPKNEFQRYYQEALKKYDDIVEFKELYERINFIHLSEESQFKGALDPLVFLKGDKAIQTAMMILNTLADVSRSRDESVYIYDSIIEEVDNEEFPTLTGVLERIKKKNDTLGKYISRYQYGLGRMLFGDKNSRGLDFERQINVLGLQGLKLPDTENMTDEERIGLCLMMSISKYVHIFSTNKNEDAMIIFDEAWILKRSEDGQALIDEMLRTGRSLRTDIILVTQAFDDYNVDTTKEQIGVKFAFRPKSDDSVKPILRFFDMEENVENIDVVNSLKAGMCLFQDHLGRNQAIAIDVLFDEWFEAFKTTDKESKAIHYEEIF